MYQKQYVYNIHICIYVDSMCIVYIYIYINDIHMYIVNKCNILDCIRSYVNIIHVCLLECMYVWLAVCL